MKITTLLQAVDVIQAALPDGSDELDKVYNTVSMHCLDACYDGRESELEKIQDGRVERLSEEYCTNLLLKTLGKELNRIMKGVDV